MLPNRQSCALSASGIWGEVLFDYRAGALLADNAPAAAVAKIFVFLLHVQSFVVLGIGTSKSTSDVSWSVG
jgi:hypothetical protein